MTPEFCILPEESFRVSRGEVPTLPQLPGSPSSSSTCPHPGAPAMLSPWTRISSTPTASQPAASIVRRVTWWRTATAAWCTCQVRPRNSRHSPGPSQAAQPLVCVPSVLASLALVPEIPQSRAVSGCTAPCLCPICTGLLCPGP